MDCDEEYVALTSFAHGLLNQHSGIGKQHFPGITSENWRVSRERDTERYCTERVRDTHTERERE